LIIKGKLNLVRSSVLSKISLDDALLAVDLLNYLVESYSSKVICEFLHLIKVQLTILIEVKLHDGCFNIIRRGHKYLLQPRNTQCHITSGMPS
jgi:hypothetical protein